MKRNKVIAMLLGMGLMAGTLAVPVTVPKTTVYAAASTQQVIGHGEWKQEKRQMVLLPGWEHAEELLGQRWHRLVYAE